MNVTRDSRNVDKPRVSKNPHIDDQMLDKNWMTMGVESPPATAVKTSDNSTIKSRKEPINVVLLVVCVLCISCSVYNAWRQAYFEEKLRGLEERLYGLEKPSFEVMASRIRRETFSQIHRRIRRDSYQMNSGGILGDFMRTARDAPECVCPAGKFKITTIELCTNFVGAILSSSFGSFGDMYRENL